MGFSLFQLHYQLSLKIAADLLAVDLDECEPKILYSPIGTKFLLPWNYDAIEFMRKLN